MEQKNELCTTQKQGERFMKLGLDPHTADMHWHHKDTRIKSLEWELRPYKPLFFEGDGIKMMEKFATATNTFNEKMNFKKSPKETAKSYYDRTHGKDIPAWSLNALLKIIPKHIQDVGDLEIGVNGDEWKVSYIMGFCGRKNVGGKSLFNAIIELVEWLLENGHLSNR